MDATCIDGNWARFESPAGGTDIANRITLLVGVAAEDTFAANRAPFGWGSASDPANEALSAPNDGGAVTVMFVPVPSPSTNAADPVPSSIGQYAAGFDVPVSRYTYRVYADPIGVAFWDIRRHIPDAVIDTATSRWEMSHSGGHDETSPVNRYPEYATPDTDVAFTDTRTCAFRTIFG
jgi:hypothetical protein